MQGPPEVRGQAQSQFSDEQIVAALKQAELGVPIPELCRKYGVSQQTFCRWRSKYGGLAPSELRRLKELERERSRPVKWCMKTTGRSLITR